MTDDPPLPPWADPDSPDFDPLLAIGYPHLDPPSVPGPPRADWDGTVRLLEAAARALLAARPAYVTTAALAARLGVTAGTVRRMVRDGRLVAIKRGPTDQSRLYIPASEVDRLVGGTSSGGPS